MAKVELKPIAEVKAKLREMIHRAGNRYVEASRVPKPENCAHAPKMGNKFMPCTTCGAKPGEGCKIESQFQPRYTFGELKQMFKERLENREWLLRNHRDIAMLLWVLNQLTPQEEPDPPPLPTYPEEDTSLWARIEGTTVHLSPALAKQVTEIINTNLKKPDAEVLQGPALGEQA